ILAGPDVDTAESVNDSVPGDSRAVPPSPAPLLTLSETSGVLLNARPPGRASLIALPAWREPVAFSSISISPRGALIAGAGTAGVASAFVLVPVLGRTWMVTVAAALVSAAEQFGPGVPQLSGLPRSVTVNANVSVPLNPGSGV